MNLFIFKSIIIELDTKNKIGRYEVLFRDWVLLNKNFLALKPKYKNERDSFKKIILDLNTTIDNTNKENENLIIKLNKQIKIILIFCKISRERFFWWKTLSFWARKFIT